MTLLQAHTSAWILLEVEADSLVCFRDDLSLMLLINKEGEGVGIERHRFRQRRDLGAGGGGLRHSSALL